MPNMSHANDEALKQFNMAKNFLELSSNQESCATLRTSGCIPILVQMLHANDAVHDEDEDHERKLRTRDNASEALHNIVHNNPVDKERRREVKSLRLLDQILDYSNFLKTMLRSGGEAIADDEDRHPLAAISLLMKASFDRDHRTAMCELGALKAIPNLVHLDHAVHGPPSAQAKCCNALRRYALMALTNLTFGDENNKAYLCGQKSFMAVVIALLDTAADDLLQVVASVLRNLSWRADKNMKTIFNELGTVTALTLAAMRHTENENTLKAIMSALWNLSAHCSTNKAEFCAVNGALAFLVRMLSYEGPSKTMKIIENAGGILRNVSSHIAVCEPYRQVLREHNCLGLLLQHLKSDNPAVVGNACGTLWNLSARCPTDQHYLLDNGAVGLLRALASSKNTMIVEGSASALKNLINFRIANERKAQSEASHKAQSSDCTSTSSDALQRRFSAVLGASSQQLSQHAIGSSMSLSRVSLGQKCKSPSSVYSAKSDSATLPRKSSALRGNYSDSINMPRPESSSAVCSSFAKNTSSTEDPNEERPIDYSMKYFEQENRHNKTQSTVSYAETADLDQPTDFSMRYLEAEAKTQQQRSTAQQLANINSTQDMLLADADVGLKHYPRMDTEVHTLKPLNQLVSSSDSLRRQSLSNPAPIAVSSDQRVDGIHTPERPTYYCEEGTPGYFSRYDSLNSLVNITNTNTNQHQELEESKQNSTTVRHADAGAATAAAAPPPPPPPSQTTTVATAAGEQATEKKSVTDDQKQAAMSLLNSAMETPLMFSRRSSMDSLVNDNDVADNNDHEHDDDDVDAVVCVDDNASVISDYSRMQSGVISPIPDSPTQSMPQFARHIVVNRQLAAEAMATAPAKNYQQQNVAAAATVESDSRRKPITSVFEDDINTFAVEHTPAQFSHATSLSNISNIIHDEQTYKNNNNDNDDNNMTAQSASTGAHSSVVYGPTTNVKYDEIKAEDPIAKMRRGGDALPAYLPVSDEMNKYLVENSPCNYSLISGLSSLTIGTDSYAGPARNFKPADNKSDTQMNHKSTPPPPPTLPRRADMIDAMPPPLPAPQQLQPQQQQPQQQQQNRQENKQEQEEQRQQPQQQQLNDSLSSLSIDSDDDTQLLNQAIAAGSGRTNNNNNNNNNSNNNNVSNTLPRATKSTTKRQPVISAAAAAATLTPTAMAAAATTHGTGTKTDYSSTESDSLDDDVLSKSLFEQCILSGMHKSSDALSETTQTHQPFTNVQNYTQRSHNNATMTKTAATTTTTPIMSTIMSTTKTTRTATQLTNDANGNISQTRRHTKLYATLSPPRRRTQLQMRERERERERGRLQQDRRLLSECINMGITRRSNAAENCVSNQVRHFEEMLANTNPPKVMGTRSQLTKNGSVQHWV